MRLDWIVWSYEVCRGYRRKKMVMSLEERIGVLSLRGKVEGESMSDREVERGRGSGFSVFFVGGFFV